MSMPVQVLSSACCIDADPIVPGVTVKSRSPPLSTVYSYHTVPSTAQILSKPVLLPGTIPNASAQSSLLALVADGDVIVISTSPGVPSKARATTAVPVVK